LASEITEAQLENLKEGLPEKRPDEANRWMETISPFFCPGSVIGDPAETEKAKDEQSVLWTKAALGGCLERVRLGIRLCDIGFLVTI